MSKESLDKFRDSLHQTDWSAITNLTSAQEKFDNFSRIYTATYETCFTKKKIIKKQSNSKPWILPWLAGACARKNKAYNTYIKFPTLQNKATYQNLKKFTAKHVKKAKLQYYSDYFKKYSSDGRKQWQMINSLLSRKRPSKKCKN